MARIQLVGVYLCCWALFSNQGERSMFQDSGGVLRTIFRETDLEKKAM